MQFTSYKKRNGAKQNVVQNFVRIWFYFVINIEFSSWHTTNGIQRYNRLWFCLPLPKRLFCCMWCTFYRWFEMVIKFRKELHSKRVKWNAKSLIQVTNISTKWIYLNRMTRTNFTKTLNQNLKFNSMFNKSLNKSKSLKKSE